MASVMVQPLSDSRRLQPGYREQRRKKVEEYLAKKMSNQKPKQLEIRSPLMERSNTALQNKPGQMNPMERKPAKPFNKENVQACAKKDGKNVTLSQTFLKTKTSAANMLKDVKVNVESSKEKTKPVLGAYRGKIVQSKIHSFRNPSENTNGKILTAESKRNVSKSAESRLKALVTQKPIVKPSSAVDVKQKRALVPPVSILSRTSTRVVIKSKSESVTVQKTSQIGNQKKSIGGNLQQRSQPVKPVMKNVPTRSGPRTNSTKGAPNGPINTVTDHLKTVPAKQPATASRYSRPNESAEERKARLAEWRASKGKVMKRPPLSVVVPSTYKVEKAEHETKKEPEEPKEETRQLYWATMAEEDEQAVFTLRFHQIFGDCQKLIDKGCPKEEILSILETQVQDIPEAKKNSRYWECLAHLEQRDGQLYKVIAVCEEAVAAGAQPLEELRAILADALEKLKAESDENLNGHCEKEEHFPAEVMSEPTEKAVDEKKKRGRRKAVKLEIPSPSTSPQTHKSPEATASVIRFNIATTPRLEKMKNLQMNDGSSSINSYKYVTPVRRSRRLERKSHTLPNMLKDHDPCVAGISQLEDLECQDTCQNAYIFRRNDALKETTAKNATKKSNVLQRPLFD